MRVVLDTNIVISRFITHVGCPVRIFDLLDNRQFDILVSEPLLAEYDKVLRYDHIRRRHQMNDTEIAHTVETIRSLAIFVQLTHPLHVVTEAPADNKIIECAVGGRADYIVTGDDDLLRMGEYHGIQILRPATFVALLTMKHAA